jgi:hypothetical protein
MNVAGLAPASVSRWGILYWYSVGDLASGFPGVQLRRTGNPLTGDPRLGRAKDAGGYLGPIMC